MVTPELDIMKPTSSKKQVKSIKETSADRKTAKLIKHNTYVKETLKKSITRHEIKKKELQGKLDYANSGLKTGNVVNFSS
jgi:hypothetical protein